MTNPQTKSEIIICDQHRRDVEEVLQFPARFLLDLPLKTILTLRHQNVEDMVLWTNFSVKKPRLTDPPIVFDKEELLALISASEADRMRPEDLTTWCWMKQETPEFVLDEDIALGGTRLDRKQYWKLKQLLKWLNLSLTSVEIAESFDRRGESVQRAA
jgi:hypothetical protein